MGHILIDYRIAGAMLNFTHKPITPDRGEAKSIARSMRKKCKISNNKLEFLLSKTLGTKAIRPIEMKDLSDFPKFKSKEMFRKLTFGTFQLRLCKSYLKDILNNGSLFIVSDEFLKDIKDKNLCLEMKNSRHKIIAMEIIPRHGRSSKNKTDNICDEADDDELENKDKKTKKNNDKKLTKKFSKVYKAFIQYEPDTNSAKGIKGLIR